MTVVSSAMQDEIKKLVPEATLPTIAPMGTDLKHLFTPDDSVCRKLNQLLFVGRLVEKKGLKYLLQAMPEILKNIQIHTCHISIYTGKNDIEGLQSFSMLE